MQTIERSIMANLKTTLEKVPGFSSSTVFKFSAVGHSYDVVPCMDLKFENSILLKKVNNLSEREMTVYIDLIARDESTDTDDYILNLAGEIEKALMEDPGRGGFALGTDIKNIESGPIIAGQPETECLLTLSIIYRRQTKHPEKIN